MDISVWSFILLFFILVGIQLFMDAIFYFLCYLTGVLVLKTVVILNTKYDYLPYKLFKEAYRTKHNYKVPMLIGAVLWFGLLFLLISLK